MQHSNENSTTVVMSSTTEVTQGFSSRDFGASCCEEEEEEEEDELAISNRIPRVSICPSISLAPGEGKKRDPDNILTR